MPYNPYLLRFQLDALQRRARAHDQRGRDLASFWAHLATAEAHLARRPRFPWSNSRSSLTRAHRSGYAALRSLNAARVGRQTSATIFTPTLAWDSPRRDTRCDGCGAEEAPLRFWNDFFCVTCFVREAVIMRHAAAFWSAPDDATFHTFAVEAATVQARSDAERVLQTAPKSMGESTQGASA